MRFELAQQWHGRVWLNPPLKRDLKDDLKNDLKNEEELRKVNEADGLHPVWMTPA